ncbi:MAG: hypothetical protein KDD70_01200, partial [Bdellovibrionales bacterium]|nr:hypothetical protein [Bdellovibrionales bacterium]
VGATGRVWGLDLKQGTEAEFQEIARLRKNCITIQIVALSTGEIVTLNSEGDLEVLRNTGKENERETAQLISPKLTKAPSFVMPLKGGGFILSRDSREIEIWKARDTNHGIDYTLNSSLVLSESPSHIEELPGDRLAIGFPSGLISITSMVSGKTEELWRCQNDYEVTALKLLSDGTLLVGEGCYRSYMDPAFLHEFKPGEGPSSTKESI